MQAVKKYNRIGHVFRNRFESESITNEKQLYNCIKYIYDNPIKARITSRPGDYPYSNYNKKREFDYMLINDKFNFLDIKEDNNQTDTIHKILEKNKINTESFKKDKTLLNKIVKKLKDEYQISFRKMEEKFDISREKLRKIYYS